MTPTQPTAPARRAAFVFVTLLLDMLALGIVIPVLPKLVVDFLAGDTARAAEIYGIFGTVFALMQFLFSLLHGALADRFGRRLVILLSNFGLGLDYVLMALAPNLVVAKPTIMTTAGNPETFAPARSRACRSPARSADRARRSFPRPCRGSRASWGLRPASPAHACGCASARA